MSNIGIKITKDGKDVSSTGLADYVYWSKYPSMNIKYRGSATMSTTYSDYDEELPASATVFYTHNFGYVPQFMAFVKSYLSENVSKFAFADYVNLDFDAVHEDAGSNLYENIHAYADDTKIYFTADLYNSVEGATSSIAHTYAIDFILFMEEATPVPT
jgi:hypothetical protein